MISTLELTKAASQKEGSHYGATKGSDATEGPPADATHSERFRDNLFAFLDGPCMFKVNIANIIIIIVGGITKKGAARALGRPVGRRDQGGAGLVPGRRRRRCRREGAPRRRHGESVGEPRRRRRGISITRE